MHLLFPIAVGALTAVFALLSLAAFWSALFEKPTAKQKTENSEELLATARWFALFLGIIFGALTLPGLWYLGR